MRFADGWLTVVGTALALQEGQERSVSQSSAPEMSADDTRSLLRVSMRRVCTISHIRTR